MSGSPARSSRREADEYIERGWVFVDGERISELGSRIDPNAEITISKEAEKDQAKQVTILLNKPVGYVSGQPEADCKPAVTLISAEAWVRQSGDPEFKPWMLRGLAPGDAGWPEAAYNGDYIADVAADFAKIHLVLFDGAEQVLQVDVLQGMVLNDQNTKGLHG